MHAYVHKLFHFTAYWITHYCVKKYFDKEINLDPVEHDTTCVKEIMFKYFGVRSQCQVLIETSNRLLRQWLRVMSIIALNYAVQFLT